MKQPFSKWYWSDWRGDPKLKLCSLAARGLWMEMLALMHEAEPYGHLLIEGQAPGISGLAAIIGRPIREVKAAYAELEKWKVFSVNDQGIPFSRRMIRDRAKADKDRENGGKGGNPKITGKDNGGVNPQDNPHGNKPEARGQSHLPEARDNTQSDLSSQSLPDTGHPAASLSHERYAEVSKKVDAILNNPNLLVFGRVDVWLKSGADPEADIYPTLERMKAGWKGSNLKYFEGAIADALAARTAPLAVGAANSNASRFSPTDIIRNLPKDA